MLFGILAALSFSLMALFVKFAADIPTQELILARSIFTLVASLAVIKSQSLSVWGKKGNWPFLLLRGFAGYLALSAYFFSITKLPLGVASLIQYLSPVFSAILAYYFLREDSSFRQWICLAFGLIGVGFVSGVLPFGRLDASVPLVYWLACILSAVISGVAYSTVRKLNLTGESADVIIFYFPLVSFPFALLASLQQWVTPTLLQGLNIFLVCLFSYIGQLFLTFSLRSEKTSAATNMLYFGALFASTWGFMFLNEHPTLGFFIGATLIIGTQLVFGKKQIKPKT
ncbi:MAG: DMT family transporter [Candidatus Caenarcaniphilales bacterium]|nr:DMT family transporter [Candidatus Caenarcaniphilales bacterium]